jgi:hypothetical protein
MGEGHELLPGPREGPLYSLQTPQHVEGCAVLRHGICVHYSVQRHVHRIVKREHLPPRVPGGWLRRRVGEGVEGDGELLEM